LAALDGVEQRFAAVRVAGERLLAGLDQLPGFKVERVEHGSNIAYVHIPPQRLAGLQARLTAAGIRTRDPVEGKLELNFNESLLRRDTAYVLAAFA
jgi:threonine aldolase